MDRYIIILYGQYFIGDGFSNLIRGFIVGRTGVCRMSKLAPIKYASIDMHIKWTKMRLMHWIRPVLVKKKKVKKSHHPKNHKMDSYY